MLQAKSIRFTYRSLLQRGFSTILKCGVDEAGRGAVLGPLIVCGLVLSDEDESQLHVLGVRDSKNLSQNKREQLNSQILNRAICCKIHNLSSHDLDAQRSKGQSLNVIEENIMLDILRDIREVCESTLDCVIVDAFVSKGNRLEKEVKKMFPHSQVICSFHADSQYPCVSAASVVAKVERDKCMKDLEIELQRTLGTGYPHDPLTIRYLKQYVTENRSAPSIARSSWITVQKLLDEI